ncbi:MAG: hypothetical protein GY711_28775 [bacterium]|nr:hypothetical protein [bacterium]
MAPNDFFNGLLALQIALTLAVTGGPLARAGDDPALASAVQRAVQELDLDAIWQVGTPIDGVDAAWQAPDHAQDMRTFFVPDGIRVVPGDHDAGWSTGLRFAALARGAEREEVGVARIAVAGPRVEYRRLGRSSRTGSAIG